jgi:hypothetical protein
MKDMPKLYWVQSYYIAQNKQMEYHNWMKSSEAKELRQRFERQTGIKYVDTYWKVLGFGDYDCEDWYELPNWAAMDKIRDAMSVMEEMYKATWKLVDTTRGSKLRVVRTTEDVMTPKPPE